MRKHWLAVLSILGVASSSTPASAQVLNGQKAVDTKSESTMKMSKLSREDAASKDARLDKRKVQSAEGGQTSDASALKMRKAGGDPQAQRADYLKSSKSKAELKASQGSAEYKEQKAVNENNAAAVDSFHKAAVAGGSAGKVAPQDIRHKAQKNASELKATQNEATIKLTNAEQKKQVNAASPKKK